MSAKSARTDVDLLARERQLLQIAVLAGGVVPVSGGLAGVLLGPAMLDATAADVPSLDSHVRYLSGLLLGIGLVAWACVARIERCGDVLRCLAALVLVGGLARAASLVVAGSPSWPMLGGLVMELIVTPLLALWQWRFQRRWLRHRPSRQAANPGR